jgi:hypothetical protein
MIEVTSPFLLTQADEEEVQSVAQRELKKKAC